jgi:hypothetical protein
MSRPVVSYSRSARERYASIDNQRLSMCAIVQPPKRVPPDRIKPGNLAIAGFEYSQDIFTDVGSSHRIE